MPIYYDITPDKAVKFLEIDHRAGYIEIAPDRDYTDVLRPYYGLMRQAIIDGRAGQRIKINKNDLSYESAIIGPDSVSEPSSYPDWYGPLGRDKGEILTALDNLIQGRMIKGRMAGGRMTKNKLPTDLMSIAKGLREDYINELKGEYLRLTGKDAPDYLTEYELNDILQGNYEITDAEEGDISFDFGQAA